MVTSGQAIVEEKKQSDGNAILQGVLAKTRVKTWCFDGQFVVFCVVIVAF